MTADICPPDVFEHVVLTVSRQPGGYCLAEHHKHKGHPWDGCPVENYAACSWEELSDLVAAVLDARRPGRTADPWEQLELFGG